MRQKLFTAREVHKQLVQTVRAKLSEVSTQIEDLHKREVQSNLRASKLAKAAPCPLCKKADHPGQCTCVLRKDEEGPRSKACPNCDKEVAVKDGKVGHHFIGRQAKPCGGVGKPCKTVEKTIGDPADLLFGDEPKKDKVLPKGPYPKGSTGHEEGGGACSECGVVGHKPSEHTKKDEMGDGLGSGAGMALGEAGVKKEEMVPISMAVVDKKRPGAVLPSDKKPAKVAAEGSGGKLTKKSETPLRKDTNDVAPAAKRPVAAKQIHLPGMTARRPAPNIPIANANRELAGFKSVATSPVIGGVNGGAKLPGAAKPVAAVNQMRGWSPQMVPQDASPKAQAGRIAALHAEDLANDKEAGGVGVVNALRAKFARPDAKDGYPPEPGDKKAGGVGFLANLISRFKGVGNAGWKQVGSPTATRNRIGVGLGALARNEKTESDLKKDEDDGPTETHKEVTCPHCKKRAETIGGKIVPHSTDDSRAKMCNGKAIGPFPGALKKAMGKCLFCKSSEHGGVCAGSKS